jgi:hypothetical protein
MERCLACEADGEQGIVRCISISFCALSHKSLLRAQECRLTTGSARSSALLTIGLASEAAHHGWRTLRLPPRTTAQCLGSNLAF